VAEEEVEHGPDEVRQLFSPPGKRPLTLVAADFAERSFEEFVDRQRSGV